VTLDLRSSYPLQIEEFILSLAELITTTDAMKMRYCFQFLYQLKYTVHLRNWRSLWCMETHLKLPLIF